MGFSQGWKQSFGEKLDACTTGLGDLNCKLGEIDRKIAAVHKALTKAVGTPSSPPQVSSEEFYKLREAVSTGTMVLREENRELRRRQEKMLGDLKDLRLEVTGGWAGAHSPPASPLPEADEDDDAESGTAEVAVDPPSVQSSEESEEQDSHRQEGYVGGKQDDNRREPESNEPESPVGAEISEETSEEQRVRAVKKAAEAAFRRRSHDSGNGSGGATAPPGSGGPQPHGSQDPQPPREPLAEHAELLLAAAGVSRVDLVCHRDTWEFLLAQAARHPRFRVPHSVEKAKKGKVRTHLSGPSLIAALISLWGTRNASSETVDSDWAMATVLYDRIRKQLADAEPGDNRRTVLIALDDGVEPEETTEPPDEAPGTSGKEPDAA